MDSGPHHGGHSGHILYHFALTGCKNGKRLVSAFLEMPSNSAKVSATM